MGFLSPLDALIEQLVKLPGVGPRSASRLAFFFLSLPEKQVNRFAEVLNQTRKHIRYCQRCYNISFDELCPVCQDPERDQSKVCLVAEPKDIFALERMGEFKGIYHVLGGLISPLDGLHPEVLRLSELVKRLEFEPIKEIVFAINPSVEGDATVLYLQSLLKKYSLHKTRLAYGLPMGSELDYADEHTLKKAFQNRTLL